MEFALDNNLGISDGLPKIINQNGLVESTGYKFRVVLQEQDRR